MGYYRDSNEETLDHECRREKSWKTLSLHLQEGIIALFLLWLLGWENILLMPFWKYLLQKVEDIGEGQGEHFDW